MSGGGSKSAGNQKTQSGPPKWMRPYYQGALSEGLNLYNESEFYPGQTYADFTPDQLQYHDLARQRALQGTNPIFGDVNSELSKTLQGDYLYGGEGFNAAYDAASRKIMPQVNSQFGRAGRSGSGLAQIGMTQALGDSFAGLYNNERARQMQAAGLAPQSAQTQQNLDFLNLSLLDQIGGQQQQQNQLGINEAMARHDFPWQKLQRYAGLLGGLGPQGGQVQQQGLYRNPWAGALGGGLMGFALTGSPWGALAGGGMGLLQ